MSFVSRAVSDRWRFSSGGVILRGKLLARSRGTLGVMPKRRRGFFALSFIFFFPNSVAVAVAMGSLMTGAAECEISPAGLEFDFVIRLVFGARAMCCSVVGDILLPSESYKLGSRRDAEIFSSCSPDLRTFFGKGIFVGGDAVARHFRGFLAEDFRGFLAEEAAFGSNEDNH